MKLYFLQDKMTNFCFHGATFCGCTFEHRAFYSLLNYIFWRCVLVVAAISFFGFASSFKR